MANKNKGNKETKKPKKNTKTCECKGKCNCNKTKNAGCKGGRGGCSPVNDTDMYCPSNNEMYFLNC